MSLTRSDLESRRLQGLVSEFTKLGLHVLSEAELQESIRKVLLRQAVGSDVWLFAYGSLIWNLL